MLTGNTLLLLVASVKRRLEKHFALSVFCSAAVVVFAGCAGRQSEPSASATEGNLAAPKELARTYPAYVSAYDIRTPEDQFYYHFLGPMCQGPNLAQWPLVEYLVDLGGDLVDAPTWASIATETIYISDQPRARPIMKMVEDCAKILGVKAPPVHIDGNSEPNAYVAGLREPHVMVLTSGLLDLYEETPEELRFIIGHELGHLKADHLRTHFIGHQFVEAIRDLGKTGTAAWAADFVAPVAVHNLLHWFRESEYSADRAGLLCIGGDTKVATQALLRLLHQTKPSNKLFDPSHPDFDANLVINRQMQIRQMPFVEVMVRLNESGISHPFVAERCAALQTWAKTSHYLAIMERQVRPESNVAVAVKTVEAKGIPLVDTYVPLVDSGAADPYVKLTFAGDSAITKHLTDVRNADWKEIDFSTDYHQGAHLIVELWDHNAVTSDNPIGSCIVPLSPQLKGTQKITTSIRLDVLSRSSSVQLPQLTLRYELRSK